MPPDRADDEGSSLHHSMTWSARCSSDGGIVRPRALAVLRLMTSSNFVGCSTGRSAGLGALQDLVHEDGRAPPDVDDVRRHRTSAPRPRHTPELIHGRKPAPGSQLRDSPGLREEERSATTRSAPARASVAALKAASISPRLEPRATAASILAPGGGFGRLPVQETRRPRGSPLAPRAGRAP